MVHDVSLGNSLTPDNLGYVMTEGRVTLLIRVPAGLKSRLSDLAKLERRSLSKQVELLLEQCLENREKPPAQARTGRNSRT